MDWATDKVWADGFRCSLFLGLRREAHSPWPQSLCFYRNGLDFIISRWLIAGAVGRKCMKLVLKTVEQKSENQPANRDTTQYVRKNWSIFLAYYVVASLAVGLGIAMAMFLFAVLGISKRGNRKPLPIHNSLMFSMALLGTLSAILFLVQLITGPFVFTKDVVCRKCHTRLKVNRIAFFTGKYSRPPRCECGGKIEPAFLWKPDQGTP
jgi:hypothetical protein